MSVYLDLTREFNAKGPCAVLSSGQAVVWHRLAIMSKDGDWILRETPSTMEHILDVLESHDAHYRFGAPLDVRWMAGGWSSHFEFKSEGLRVRTDFVTRPPRLSPPMLDGIWREAHAADIPVVNMRALVEIKKTDRERDYAVIGELARRLASVDEQLLCSRSARDLARLADRHPEVLARLADERPVLRVVAQGRDALEAGLDAERRTLMRANETRLAAYRAAAEAWINHWPQIQIEMEGRPLSSAHRLVVGAAESILPFKVGS